MLAAIFCPPVLFYNDIIITLTCQAFYIDIVLFLIYRYRVILL
nr:MAG TPA_asm: hypothetical protein [Bacteriophage sp.]